MATPVPLGRYQLPLPGLAAATVTLAGRPLALAQVCTGPSLQPEATSLSSTTARRLRARRRVGSGPRNWDLAGPKPESDSGILVPAGIPSLGTLVTSPVPHWPLGPSQSQPRARTHGFYRSCCFIARSPKKGNEISALLAFVRALVLR